jgi:hypothetical protein
VALRMAHEKTKYTFNGCHNLGNVYLVRLGFWRMVSFSAVVADDHSS